jgi:rare lipoprotein A
MARIVAAGTVDGEASTSNPFNAGMPGGKRPNPLVTLPLVMMGCLILANCSTPDQARVRDPKYGVYASRRVVEGTDRIDPSISRRGVYMVGRPYQVAGRTYVPREDRDYEAVGLASWYGDDFHGRLTANGEVFDMHDISAAHATMPLPSYARVTNLANGNSIVVRVNDRGPYHGHRVIDVSRRAAQLLAFEQQGVGQVKVEYLGRAQPTGSDEAMLLATLRTDGSRAPAPQLRDGEGNNLVAEAPARPAAAMLAAYRPQQAAPETDLWGGDPFPQPAILPPARPPNAGKKRASEGAAPAPIPTPIPLPPQRSANAGPVGGSGLDGAQLRLTIADIVGPAAADQSGKGALAYAGQPAQSVDAEGVLVDAGFYSDKAKAEKLLSVLSQAGEVSVTSVDEGGQKRWHVQAGPFSDPDDAAAVATLARNAGASTAAVIN